MQCGDFQETFIIFADNLAKFADNLAKFANFFALGFTHYNFALSPFEGWAFSFCARLKGETG